MTRHVTKRLAVLFSLLGLVAGAASAQTAEPAPTPPAAPPAPPAIAATPAAQTVTASPRAATTYDLGLGAGFRYGDVSGTREKLEEYGGIGEGFVVDALLLRSRSPAGLSLELAAANATRDDERYRLALAWRDRVRIGVEYQAVPHRFAPGTFLWGGIGTGNVLVADVVQAELEANEVLAAGRGAPPPSATDPTAPIAQDTAQQGIVNGLYAATDPTRVGLVRKRLGGGVEVALPAGWRVWARAANENRVGTSTLGTGAYERWQNANSTAADPTLHTIDRFIVLGAELPEPLDYRTTTFAVGTGVQRRTWLADVELVRTQFRNFEDVLLWDNPFRITDEDQNGSVDRSRFTVGQLVLPPNSVSDDVTASAALDLPLHGRLGASVSWGRITQDDAFFPYTRNTAITATDFAGAPAGSAATAPLPARDLGGDVRTLAGNLSAAFRPVAPATVTARYRVYRYDGRSDEIVFPGYAAFGESGWRRERNDVSSALDGPVANEVFDYWRHEADLGVDWRLTRAISASVEGGWEAWRYDHLRLDALDEFFAGAGVSLRPARNATVKARYRYADREADGYERGATAANPEARGLMNYNWSDRRRHLADVRARYAPSRTVSLGVLGRLVDDDHGGRTEGDAGIDAFRFGRSALRRWLASADVGLSPTELLSFRATYTLERRKEEILNGAKDDGPKATDDFGFTDNFAPENYWNSNVVETVNTLGLGATVLLARGLLAVDLGYDLSFGDIEVDTWNPNPIVGTTLENAKAVDWPTVTSRQHDAYADVSYQLSPNVRAGARYLYATHELDDWAWDIMQPYMAGLSAENSTRMVFADTTYDRYEAHVGTVYVAGSF